MAQAITVWINGRFLQRKVTGVERVAQNLMDTLGGLCPQQDGRLMYRDQAFEFRIAVPKSDQPAWPAQIAGMPVVEVGTRSGHAWEQIDLAQLPAQDWVISLCNTGPMLRRNQLLMLHDAQVFAIPSNFNWKFRLWYKLLFSLAGRRSAGLLTNSAFSRDEIVRYVGLSRDKFTVMHLGCDHFQPGGEGLPAELIGKLPERPFVLAVSSVNPNKNFGAVIKALEILGDRSPPCVFVGQQYGQVFGSVQLDTSRITHLGYVSDEALAALYQRALCLAYPSLYEGFGLPPVEAMRCGCPVVVSNVSSLPEVCEDAALYCDPHDPSTLAQAIQRLSEDPELMKKIRVAGLAHAQKYSWRKATDVMLGKLLQLVRQD